MFRGENVENNIPESKMRAVRFYLENKEFLEEMCIIGDPYIKAMAMTIIVSAKRILNNN
ncbi:MAG: hypothetical protein BWX56_00848 [Euryarchaeota archaeon ADurb.Bin023]|nr:MAG: hypothetical protein BWX56_00848 [Euryarchaeota archaeon ADurb.Bin023]